MRAFLFLGLLFFFLGSCQPEDNVIYIKFDQAQGIKAQHYLILKGVKVGEVTKVDLTSDFKVLASVRLSDSVQLPKDSYFTISNKDLFTKVIVVQEGKSKLFLQRGDTIQGLITDDFFKRFDFKDSNPLEGLDKIL
jgi:ABC-type transporter Mla subunit MlaD